MASESATFILNLNSCQKRYGYIIESLEYRLYSLISGGTLLKRIDNDLNYWLLHREAAKASFRTSKLISSKSIHEQSTKP